MVAEALWLAVKAVRLDDLVGLLKQANSTAWTPEVLRRHLDVEGPHFLTPMITSHGCEGELYYRCAVRVLLRQGFGSCAWAMTNLDLPPSVFDALPEMTDVQTRSALRLLVEDGPLLLDVVRASGCDLPEPWWQLEGGDRDRLQEEVLREVAPEGHALSGRRFDVVARCAACGEVVVRLDDETHALVHPTWSGTVESPPLPRTTLAGGYLATEAAVVGHATEHG